MRAAYSRKNIPQANRADDYQKPGTVGARGSDARQSRLQPYPGKTGRRFRRSFRRSDCGRRAAQPRGGRVSAPHKISFHGRLRNDRMRAAHKLFAVAPLQAGLRRPHPQRHYGSPHTGRRHSARRGRRASAGRDTRARTQRDERVL